MRTQEALDLANDVIDRADAHILWHREGHELAMTLAFAVKALALECEGLQGQINALTLHVDDVSRAEQEAEPTMTAAEAVEAVARFAELHPKCPAGAEDRAERWRAAVRTLAERFPRAARSDAP